MNDRAYQYDLAVSFAGEQREYVASFVDECKQRALTVFYDADMTIDYWGTNFIFAFRRLYGGRDPRYVVPFISAEYLAKPYPIDEFAAAVEQSFHRNDVYILPVVVGAVTVPPELLNPAIGYLRADDHTPAQLADAMLTKLGRARPAPAAPAVTAFRSPRMAPKSFDPRATLEAALVTVGKRFNESAAAALESYGLACHVSQDAAGVDIRVEEAGRPLCGMSLWFDRSNAIIGADRLGMSFAWPTNDRRGMNGWVSATWDPVSSSAVLKFTDFSLGVAERDLTVDEFVTVLWEKMLTFIEQRVR